MPYKPTDEDDKLWSHTTKGAEKNKDKAKTAPLPKIKPKKKQIIKPPKEILGPLPNRTPSPHPPQLNRRDEDRLRKGQINIEGRIDLHGLTQERAFLTLKSFILHAVAERKRCVLVITGKGRLSKPAILKQNLPHWLNEDSLAPHILKHTPAHAKDGGSGAFYIYLKRQRE